MTMTDLTPDALAQLEAKLVADLETVRRVRALLLEHRSLLTPVAPLVRAGWEESERAGSPCHVATASLVATGWDAPPAQPAKSREARVADALTALPSDTFRPEALRRALHKEGLTYDNARLRLLLTQLIRKGMVEVAEVGKGRNGSLYRRRSPPQPVEKTLLLQPPVNPG